MPYLFDLDGTLVDSAKSLISAIDKVLSENNLEKTNREENLAFAGHGLMHMFVHTCMARNISDQMVEKLSNEMLAEYQDNPISGVEAYPGVNEGLLELQKRNEVLSVVTNKNIAPTVKILEHCFPAIKFEKIYTPDQGWKEKPSQESIKDYKKRYPEGDLVYLGDTELDWQTGFGVADRVYIALWGYRSKEQLESKGIPESVMINDFKQII